MYLCYNTGGKKIGSDYIISKKVHFQLHYTDHTHTHTYIHSHIHPSAQVRLNAEFIIHIQSDLHRWWICACTCVCVLLFKITATALYAQFCVSQKRICCLSDNFIISPCAVSEYHNLLPQFSCLWFLPVNQFLQECCKKHSRGERSADFVTMYSNKPS